MRAGDGISILRGKRVSVHLEMQPGVAGLLFGDPQLTDQGITTRILAIMPEPAAGTRFQQEPKPESLSNLSKFRDRLSEILAEELLVARATRSNRNLSDCHLGQKNCGEALPMRLSPRLDGAARWNPSRVWPIKRQSTQLESPGC